MSDICLISKEGEEFKISLNSAQLMGKVSGADDTLDTNVPLRFDDVESEIMELVCNYLENKNGHTPSDIQKPLRYAKFEKCVDNAWDESFITERVSLVQLLKLLQAAEERNMDIRSLYDLCCARIGAYIRGKTSLETIEFLKSKGV